MDILYKGKGMQVMIELKNGETYNGILLWCDGRMNIRLKNVVLTSTDGSSFLKIPQCILKGSCIKYIRFSREILQEKIQTKMKYMDATTPNFGRTQNNEKNVKRGKEITKNASNYESQRKIKE